MPATNSAEEKKKKPAETSDDDDPRPPDAPPPLSSSSSSPTSPRFGFLRKALSGKKKKKKEDTIVAAGDIDELDRSLPSENKDWLTIQTDDDDDKTEDTEHVKDGDAGKVDDDDKVEAADIAAAEKEEGEGDGDDEQDTAKKATPTAAAARNSRVAHQDSITIETRTKPKFKPANFDNDERHVDARPSNPVAARFLTAAKSADTSLDLDESGYETPGDDDEDNNGGGAAKKMPVVVERSAALADPIVEKKKLQVPVAAAPSPASTAPVAPNRPGMIGTNFSSSPRSSRPSSDRQLSPNTAAAAASKIITTAAAAPAPAQYRPGMIGTNFSSSSSPSSRPSSERHLSPKSAAATATAAATGAAAAGRNYTVHEKHGESWKKLHDMFEKNKSASVPRSMMYDNPSSPRSEGYTKSKAQVGEIDSHRIKSVRELATEWNSRSPPASPTPRVKGSKESKDKEEKDKGATAESGRGSVDLKMAPLAPQLAQ